jgi:hypothetical protein
VSRNCWAGWTMKLNEMSVSIIVSLDRNNEMAYNMHIEYTILVHTGFCPGPGPGPGGLKNNAASSLSHNYHPSDCRFITLCTLGSSGNLCAWLISSIYYTMHE